MMLLTKNKTDQKMLRLFLLSATALSAAAQTLPLYINAGDASHVDVNGNQWIPDDSFINKGRLYSNSRAIAGTVDDILYKQERWFPDQVATYFIPVPSGPVEVVLHFAEIFFTDEGSRAFDIVIQGNTVATNFDIVQQAGGPARAVSVANLANVNCGQAVCDLEVSLIKRKQNPKISGIVVLPVAGNSPTPVTPMPVTAAAATPAPTRAPTLSPTKSPVMAGAVVSLKLIHAPTDQELFTLVDGMTIDLATLGVTPEFNIKAENLVGAVGSVSFVESNHNEGAEPFAYCGDNGGNYNTCPSIGLGDNTATVIAYPGGGQSGTPFPALSVNFRMVNSATPPPSPPSPGRWIAIDDNADIDVRHEACYVMVGRKAYLVGGRGTKRTDIYDVVTRSWSVGASPPIQLHHMQCVAAQGKLWIMSAWTGGYPRETNPEHGYMYDPDLDQWFLKTAMPLARRRGSGAAIVSPDETKIYISHGNSGGHETGDHAEALPYLDEYDIATDSWTALSSSAPNPRDHTGGGWIDGRICVAGGRDGGVIGWPGTAPTDCYDLTTGTWTVEAPIPNIRGGSSYGTTCDGKLMVAGGEGSNRAWDEVDVFDGTHWRTVDNLVWGRHGSGLAVDCVCDQIHIAAGAMSQGGGPEEPFVETYFPNGVDEPCLA